MATNTQVYPATNGLKSFFIIYNAQRVCLSEPEEPSQDKSKESKNEKAQYRQGEIALFSPEVFLFYQDVRANMPAVNCHGKILNTNPKVIYVNPSEERETNPIIQPTNEEVVAVLYDECNNAQETNHFRVISLRAKEYTQIRGHSMMEIIDNAKAELKERNMPVRWDLEANIDHLGSFNVHEFPVHSLPFEWAQYHKSN